MKKQVRKLTENGEEISTESGMQKTTKEGGEIMEEEKKEEKGYEYLDHTADVQLHSWGKTLREAMELVVVAMYGYMVELDNVKISEEPIVEIEATGHDMESLLYSLMDEFLFDFNTELNVCKKVEIVAFNRQNWTVSAKGYGEQFDREKHTPGTEVKAITYSAMQIHESDEKAELYVIIDI